MKIVVLLGSPHKQGSSNLLAEQFIKGAQEAGHSVETLDVAHMNIRPCVACNACKKTGSCVQKDDMETVRPALETADLIAFVTPIYYMNMSAQLKLVIDRFYAFGESLKGKKTVLLTASASENISGILVENYKAINGYLGMEDCGMVLGEGCPVPPVTAASPYPEKAYELGKSL